MKQRPFRFGVVSEGAPSREEWIAKVRKVEELGYSTFFMPDHFVNEFLPNAVHVEYEPWVARFPLKEV